MDYGNFHDNMGFGSPLMPSRKMLLSFDDIVANTRGQNSDGLLVGLPPFELGSRSDQNPSPSFMIDRFLPAPQALANFSTLNDTQPKLQPTSTIAPNNVSPKRPTTRPTTSGEGCGLAVFFPRSLKRRRVRAHSKVVMQGSLEGPGWGLRFLEVCGLEKRGTKRVEVEDMNLKPRGEKVWSLPPMSPPSESWLSIALNTRSQIPTQGKINW